MSYTHLNHCAGNIFIFRVMVEDLRPDSMLSFPRPNEIFCENHLKVKALEPKVGLFLYFKLVILQKHNRVRVKIS